MTDPAAILVGPGYLLIVSGAWTLKIHMEAAHQSAENRIIAKEAVNEYRKKGDRAT